MNETRSFFLRSVSAPRRPGKAREEANEVALSSGPGFGKETGKMRAHRRHATLSLHRRLANAQSAQQVGREERFRLGEIECLGEDDRIRGRSGEWIRDLDNDRRSPDI